jgi:hypothetical protein
VHEGYEWLYVLSGRLRLVPGPHDLTPVPGEVAEFDTRVPHWFGSADQGRVEYLTLVSKQGERMHVAVRTRGEHRRCAEIERRGDSCSKGGEFESAGGSRIITPAARSAPVGVHRGVAGVGHPPMMAV